MMQKVVFLHLLGLAAAAYEPYFTPKNSVSRCGMDIENKKPPATGDCSIPGGIFSIDARGELMGFLVSHNLGSGLSGLSISGRGSRGKGGSGPYPAVAKQDPSLPGHTIYAPETPPPGDVSMPFLAWGNGFCMTSNTGYEPFLKEVASHGYVIAADGPMSGSQTHLKDMRASITWAKSGKAKKYGNVDTTKIATMGHSCGGLEGMSVSYHNPDVSLTLMYNIATFQDDKRFLMKELKAPVAWFVGAEREDMGYETSKRDYGNLTEGVPAFWASTKTGHLGTLAQPNGGATGKATVNFLNWQFRGDEKGKEYCLNQMAKSGWTVKYKNWK